MTRKGRKDRWTQGEYLTKRHEFVTDTAGCIRRLGIDSRCRVDSYRLAETMFDYAFFYATQVNDITVVNPDIDAQREFNQRDWLASFTLVFMKVKRLVDDNQPGESMNDVTKRLWDELKGLQDDMNVLLNAGDEKGTDHE